jgi:uncharacterized protein (TIGR03435 family)
MTQLTFSSIALAAVARICAQEVKIEVASIKPVARDERSIFTNGRSVHSSTSLAGLVQYAYQTIDYRLDGLPGWIKEQGYEINVKAEGDGALTLAQFRAMLRTLMADRFQLKVHTVSEEIPVYLLTVAKTGRRFKESAPGTRGSRKEDSGRFEATRYDMDRFAQCLRREVDRRVVDLTGLTGSYDLKLEWASDRSAVAAGDADGPSIFTALQTQLGLRLEFRKKYAVEVLIIDHAEKPDEN